MTNSSGVRTGRRAGRQSEATKVAFMARSFFDVKHAIRSLSRSPGFSTSAVLTLALGIGANVAIFTVVDAAFLRPLRLPQPERLVQIQESPPSAPAGTIIPVSYPNFVDWERQSQSFESMGIGGVFPETLKRSDGNERIPVAYVSPGFHVVYGVKPLVGRALNAADDRAAAPPVALISDRFWKSHFAGEPGVIGGALTLDDQVWTIAGVIPSFQGQGTPDVSVPIVFGQDKWGLRMRENRNTVGVIARLKPGVTIGQARTEMKIIEARLAKQYPGANGGVGAVVAPLREFIGGGIRQPALLLFGAVGLLLLIACANVAGLLLARAAVRQREVAVRTALGATRAQLIRQLLTESLLLALAGAAAGVAFASFGLAGLQQIFPAAEGLGGIGIDARVLAFALLAAAVTTLLCGLVPAIQLTRSGVAEALKSGGRGGRGSAIRLHTRKLLVVGQVALAVVLSIGAGLLMRSLFAALQTNPGFRPERLVMAPILPADRKDADLSQNARLLRDVTERLAGIPGVQAVGAIDTLPISNPDSWANFYRDDRPVPAPGQVPNAMKSAATPGYFRAMGVPLLRGRLFSAPDGHMPPVKRDMSSVLAYLQSAEFVALINETMAHRFWPGEDPVGKSFRFGPPSLKGGRVRIVGVVGDARQYGLDQPVMPQYFFPADEFPFLEARLVVRTAGNVPGLASTIRQVVAEFQPDAVVTGVETMETLIGRSLSGRRNNLALLGLFSGVALLLAALGLYATMAYIVAQRTQEIGVRVALGAAAADVRMMVVREGATLAGVGVVIGLVAALAGTRVVSSMLYGVTATDLLTYTGSAVLLVLVMLVASYIPAWRASRVDPLTALHFE
ncbi:MAG TPA: ABC transporter permease [Bryobacteraceae bacterium]|nr:ABC transporter permease [Bryobacteraceae bacterium]